MAIIKVIHRIKFMKMLFGEIFWKYKKLCNYYVMIVNSCIKNIKSCVMIEKIVLKLGMKL